jgi:electron transfer flavoprotein alpha subunit
MANNILAFAESRGGDLRKVAYEAVTAARALADATGGEVHAVVRGPSGIAAKAGALGTYGADVVTSWSTRRSPTTTRRLWRRSSRSARRARLSRRRDVASAQGKDLAPRVAGKLGVPLASDLTTFGSTTTRWWAPPGEHRQGHRDA